jgi:hypothetical protein
MRVASTDGTAPLLNDGIPGGESIRAVPEGHHGTSSRQSHNDTVGPNHYWQTAQKLYAKIKKNGHDKHIGGDTLPLDSAFSVLHTDVHDRPDAV